VSLVTALIDPGEGLHTIAPPTVWATCQRHRRVVLDKAIEESVAWLGVREVQPARMSELLEWFHGSSGLCGNRGFRVVTPGSGLA
jgi:hypothetical protein